MHPASTHSLRRRRNRRGSALMLTMIFTLALGGLAISAIYMGGSTGMLTKLYDRERDYRYAAEWALAIGKSRLMTDTTFTLPDSLYVQLMNAQTVTDAGGQQVPKVLVDLYAGIGGQSSGQYGRFVELVAVAYDNGGARHVRRLELQAENFARYAMFVDQWPTAACYATGEILRGRAHSNQNWKDCGSAPGVIHTDTVSAVGSVTGTGQFQSAKINGHPVINFPSVAKLSFMPGYASSANLSFTPAAKNGATGGSRMEFTPVDLDGDGTFTGPAEGYFRVFDARAGATNNPYANGQAAFPYVSGGTDTSFLHMRTPTTTRFDDVLNLAGGANAMNRATVMNQCGVYYLMGVPARQMFIPLAAHDTVDRRYKWLIDTLSSPAALPITGRFATRAAAAAWIWNIQNSSAVKVAMLKNVTAPAVTAGRCYPAGDPRLMPVERPGLFRAFPAAAGQSIDTLPNASKRGGEDTTFTIQTKTGTWRAWPGFGGSFFTAATRRQAIEEPRLWPVHRMQNLNTKGVVYVNGDIAMSGMFRGRATVYASGNVTLIDDLVYVSNPASLPICQNLLGIITGQNMWIANTALNRPRFMDGTAAANGRFMDDNQDFFLHAVTLNGVVNTAATFGVESYNTGPDAGRQCTPVAGYTGTFSGGCIAQSGGVIERQITATFAGSGTGFAENRVKDACLDVDSPPYFPLTGRYLDNEFYEIDPAVFNAMGVAQFYRRLQSGP